MKKLLLFMTIAIIGTISASPYCIGHSKEGTRKFTKRSVGPVACNCDCKNFSSGGRDGFAPRVCIGCGHQQSRIGIDNKKSIEQGLLRKDSVALMMLQSSRK